MLLSVPFEGAERTISAAHTALAFIAENITATGRCHDQKMGWGRGPADLQTRCGMEGWAWEEGDVADEKPQENVAVNDEL